MTADDFKAMMAVIREHGVPPPYMPSLLMFAPNGKTSKLDVPDYALAKEDRNKLCTILGVMLGGFGADSYAWFSEGWLAKPNPLRPYPFMGRIDQDPEKVEVMISIGRCADGSVAGCAIELLADRKLGDVVMEEYGDGGHFQGYLTNLLPPIAPKE